MRQRRTERLWKIMITISLCMIVKNEEDVLARCLKSAQEIADEIIIADTGSTDRTKEIARRFTDKVYDFEWIDDFAAARNFAFSKATMQYMMWLDADDVIEDRGPFLKVKEELDPSVSVVMMKYDVAFDDAGAPTFSYYRERLVKRGEGFLWQGRVHEVIPPRGKIEYSDAAVSHKKLHPGDPDRNLRIFEKMLSGGEGLDPRQQFYYGRELFYHERYDDAAAVFEAFLDSGQGWTENCIDACRLLSQCCRAAGQNNEPPLADGNCKTETSSASGVKTSPPENNQGTAELSQEPNGAKLPQADNSGKSNTQSNPNQPAHNPNMVRESNDSKALSALFRSFAYDEPRAETCCDIGKLFMERGQWEIAAWWYERAAEAKRPDTGGGFVSLDCYGFIPYLQLCVCYDRLGRHDIAYQYHKKAEKIKPNDPAVLYNAEYFSKSVEI